MSDRLRPADFRFLAVCCVIFLATVWFSARYFYRAFPEASIDFRVTREQARTLAESFLKAQGLPVNGYRQASRFSYDDEAKTFLERELGLDQANRLMGRRVRLWRWSWRWFRPLQKEEYRVDVTPTGEPAGFAHEIPEAASGLSLCPPTRRAPSRKASYTTRCIAILPDSILLRGPASHAPRARTTPSPGKSATLTYTTPPIAWKSRSRAASWAGIANI